MSFPLHRKYIGSTVIISFSLDSLMFLEYLKKFLQDLLHLPALQFRALGQCLVGIVL